EDALPRWLGKANDGGDTRSFAPPDAFTRFALPLMEYRALGALMFSDTPVIHEPPSSAKEAAMEMKKRLR
ncbi:hypothetical protein, partial [Thiolapillus sp.]|uniref:hypothetical protein n=1 Tax=Thiolapillus sp. TaxID=2017437 RepID=UPI003AF8FF21